MKARVKIICCILFFAIAFAMPSCKTIMNQKTQKQKFSGYMIFVSNSDESFFMPDSVLSKGTNPAYLNNKVLYRIEKAGGMQVLKNDAKKFTVTMHFVAGADSVQKQLQTISIIPCDLFFRNENINMFSKTGYVSFEFNGGLQTFNVFNLFTGDDMNIAEKKNFRTQN